MNRTLRFIPLLLLATPAAAQEAPPFPAAHRVDVVDEYHGTRVADPYRWLEDADSPETLEWMRAQDRYLNELLADSPIRDHVRRRILEIQDFNRAGFISRAGERGIYATWPASVFDATIRAIDDDGASRTLVDPDAVLEAPGLRIAAFTPSLDGHRLLLQIAEGQSTWRELRVYDVPTGRLLPDRVTGFLATRGGVAWAGDGNSFFYTRFEVPEVKGGIQADVEKPRLMRHVVGTDPADDTLVYERPDQPDWFFFPRVTHDGRYLVINVADQTINENRLHYVDLEAERLEVVRLLDEADAQYTFEGSDGPVFLVRTTLDAPNNRVVAIDVNAPGRENWVEILPEREEPILSVSEVGERLVVQYNRDARPVLRLFERDGTDVGEAPLPGIGWVGSLGDNRQDPFTYYMLAAQYDPGTIYRLDVRTGQSERILRPDLAFDPDEYTTEQVFYESHDGTRVPMFIVHRKDVRPSTETPVYMYGYGAFGWSAFPWFQPYMIAWLDLGGVYALPGIRGGGEYGTEWWEAGRGRNKWTGINDFISAGEWLIDNGYTGVDRLVANGGSASGVLAAAALVERPDLFGAGLIDYPVIDMLRYHEFGGWPSEFGTSDDPEMFPVLLSISPNHQVEEGACYPPTLVEVGAKDEVVTPVHGYKLVAAMQAVQSCPNPIALKIAWEGGHNLGASNEEVAQTAADEFAFIFHVLELATPDRLVNTD